MANSGFVGISLSAAIALTASSAFAKAPRFAAKCPTNISVETDNAGRAYINGKRATVVTRNSNAYEIRSGRISIDVGRDATGLSATYTGPGRANGVCEIVEQETVESPAAKPVPVAGDDVPKGDKAACLRAVKRKTNNTTVVLDAVSSEANNNVTIGVGSKKARWKCLVKRGRVAEVMSLADEGAM